MPLPRHSLAPAPSYTTLLKPRARKFAVADVGAFSQCMSRLYQECFSLAREEIRTAGFRRQEAARLRSNLVHMARKVDTLIGKAAHLLLSGNGEDGGGDPVNGMLSAYRAAVRIDARREELEAEANGLDRRAVAAETSARKAASDAQRIMLRAKRSGMLRMSQEEQQEFQLILLSLFA